MDELVAHYEAGAEQARHEGWARLEYVRNLELLRRHLPADHLRIADIGGGPGTYAAPLSEAGHSVQLIDPVPRHVDEARGRRPPPKTAEIGDARELPWPSETFDAALLFGPLYHLTVADQRARALSEAYRVLEPGGLLFAMAISRYSSIRDGIDRRFLADEGFREMLDRELKQGQHRNPTAHPWGFTSAYFHRPEGFRDELTNGGFIVEALIAVEGLAGRLGNLDWWFAEDERREALLATIRRTESEPSLLGASPQLLSVCRKPGGLALGSRRA